MFPTIEEIQSELLNQDPTPIPWTYVFDWKARKLKKGLDGRYLKTKTYEEYLGEITKKILRTKQFQYDIYSEKMGFDFADELGKLPSTIALLTIRQKAQDALEAHSEIEKADVLDIGLQKNSVIFSLEILGVRGRTKLEVDVWQR